MSKVQSVRDFVNQRLTAAAEEIFELFERTIRDYEDELCRQRKLLDAVLKPRVRIERTGLSTLFISAVFNCFNVKGTLLSFGSVNSREINTQPQPHQPRNLNSHLTKYMFMRLFTSVHTSACVYGGDPSKHHCRKTFRILFV